MLDAIPFPAALEAEQPSGLMIYRGSAMVMLESTGQVDSFTLDLDARQTLTVKVDPLAGFQPAIRVIDSAGVERGITTAPAPGEALLLQSIPIDEPGLYTIEISQQTQATGSYGLHVLLNAAIERESVGGAGNDALATAQDLTASLITVGDGQRAAVTGQIRNRNPEEASESDWYRLMFQAGVLTDFFAFSPNGYVRMELYDGDGRILTYGDEDDGFTSLIQGFAPVTEGEYFLRMTGNSGSQYTLAATSGLTLANERSRLGDRVQFLAGSRPVLDRLATRQPELMTAEAEPNNSGEEANDLSGSWLSVGANEYRATIGGSFTSNWQADYFKFYASPGDTVRVTITGSSGGYLSLYDIEWDDLGYAGASYSDPAAIEFSNFTSTGEYYIEFYGRTGTYALGVTLTTPEVLTGLDIRYYEFEASAGDQLILRTMTPGDGGSAPGNDLDPFIELLNPAGTRVAWDDSSLADGRNARLTYGVPAGAAGRYSVRLLAREGAGDCLLSIEGATQPASVFEVEYTSPYAGSVMQKMESINFSFSEQVLRSSVDGADLLVNGQPVPGATVYFGWNRGVGFEWPEPLPDGTHTISLAGGSILSLGGLPLNAYSTSLTVDSTPPRVIYTSVAEGDVVLAGGVVFTIGFSEWLQNWGTLDWSAIVLAGAATGTQQLATSIVYDELTDRITFSCIGLRPDLYTLTLRSNRARDGAYNELDGDNDGLAGGDFILRFSVDEPTVALPQRLAAVKPLAGMVEGWRGAGSIGAIGDADDLTVALVSGQALSIAVDGTGMLRPALTVLDAQGQVLAHVEASAAGRGALVEGWTAPADGIYTLRVSAVDGSTGGYAVRLYTDAMLEREGRDQENNDTQEVGQDLAGAFRDMGGGLRRAALIGRLASSADGDWYSFIAGDAGAMSLVATGTFAASPLQLALFDAAGRVQGMGSQGYANVSAVIDGIRLTAGERYYARVIGDAADYSLLVIDNAGFDLEPNDTRLTAQDVTGRAMVVGVAGLGGLGRIYGLTSNGTIQQFNLLDGSVLRTFASPVAASSAFDVAMTTTPTSLLVAGRSGPIYELHLETGATLRQIPMAAGVDIQGVTFLNNEIYVLDRSGTGRLLVLDAASGQLVRTVAAPAAFRGLAASEERLYSMDSSGRLAELDPLGGEARVTSLQSGLHPIGVVGNEIYVSDSLWYTYVYSLTTFAHQRYLYHPAGLRTIGASAPAGGDWHRLNVNPGDLLRFSTTTPGNSGLDMVLELYDTNGVLLASDDNSAADGRNASLAWTVGGSVSAVYYVLVRSKNVAGVYALSIEGATAGVVAPVIVASVPGNGMPLASFPAAYRLTFSQPLDFSTLDAGALTVNGVPASSFTAIDSRTVDFGVGSAAAGDGIYTVTLGAGAVRSQWGVAAGAFSATFQLDSTGPTVVESSLQNGAVVRPGTLTWTVRFSEPLNTSDLYNNDVRLVNTATSANLSTSSFSYDAATRTLTVSWTSVPEGSYTASLLSSSSAFRDVLGNLLDGNGDGASGDAHAITLAVDHDAVAMPAPLVARLPHGGFVFESTASSLIGYAGDVDRFTADLGAGQFVSIGVSPSAMLRPVLSLLNPAGVVVASVTAEAAGLGAILQSIWLAEAGAYTIHVSGADGSTGTMALHAVVNAVLEAEVYGGGANNGMASAQDLPAELLTLAVGAHLGSVVGKLMAAEEDWYRIGGTAGTSVSIAAARTGGSLVFDVFSADGTLLAMSGGGYANVSQAIDGLTLPADGWYFVRVRGQDAAYTLTLGSGVAIGLKDALSAQTQGLGGRNWLVGTATAQPVAESEPNGSVATANTLMGAFESISATQYRAVATGVISAGNDNDWDQFRVRLSAGDTITIALNGITMSDAYLRLMNSAGTQVAYDDDGGSNGSSLLTYEVGASGDYYVVADSYGSKIGTYRLTVTLTTLAPVPELLATNAYLVEAADGDTLTIYTITPGGIAGQPVNTLDPAVRLYGPDGSLVTWDDNSAADGKNVAITYVVPAGGGGTYRLDVTGKGNGAYGMHVGGAAGAIGAGPVVVASLPSNNQPLAGPPASIDLIFSGTIRPDSVQPEDLVLTRGAIVTSVQMIDGRTVRFFISAPGDEGDYQFTLAEGAVSDLLGRPNAAFTGTYILDRLSPAVIGHTPPTDAVAPFNRLVFTFSEAMAPGSFALADIISFTNPLGENIIRQLWGVTGSGATFTVTFSGQSMAGVYTMVIGPNITDLVGNPLDQNGNGVSGEAGDTYTAAVTLRLPDLTVVAGTAPATAVPGETIEVSWTVRNAGDGAASGTWYDYVLFSVDDRFDGDNDVWVSNLNVPGALAAGDSYSRLQSITLPGWLPVGAGHLLFLTDGFKQLDESNEGNNVRALPIILEGGDLTVTGASAPASGVVGGQFDISWTVANQGVTAASGTWVDRIYISSSPTLDGSAQLIEGFGAWAYSPLAAGASYGTGFRVTVPPTATGARYLLIVTDGTNAVRERNETNNVYALPFNVSAPDLGITAATAPSSAVLGESITLSWTVSNLSDIPAPAYWNDAVYISDDPALDANDTPILLAGAATNPPLPGSAFYGNTRSVTVPITGTGGRYLIFVVDAQQSQGETNETNNTRVLPIDLYAPDLALLPSAVAPATAVVGQSIPVEWTVVNQGAWPAPAYWYDAVYLSSDTTLSVNDIAVASFSKLGEQPFPVAASYTQQRNVTIPNATPGMQYLLFVADAGNSQGETSEFNNSYAVPITILAPDLIVPQFTAPGSAVVGQQVTVSWSVRNSSTVPANFSWSDAVYLSRDSFVSIDDSMLLSRPGDGPLNSGGSYERGGTLNIPNVAPGSYYLLVMADAGRSQSETNESNNVVAVPIEIGAPDLVLSAASASATAVAGGEVQVSWTVTNAGTTAATMNWSDGVWLSTSPFGGSVVIQLASPQVPLAPGASYTVTRMVNLPASLSGSLYLVFSADAGNSQSEVSESNNAQAVPIQVSAPDLALVSVNAPAAVVVGESVSLAWTVANSGTVPALGQWSDVVYLSADAVLDPLDLFVASASAAVYSPLAPGGQYSISRTAIIPNVPPGARYLLFIANNGGAQAETGQGNNIIAVPVQVAVPDLRMDRAEAPATAVFGQTISLAWSVTNTGTVPAMTSWHDAVYLSFDATYDTADQNLFSRSANSHSPLAAGGQYSASQEISLPVSVGTGLRYLLFVADSGNRQGETSETNNVLAMPIIIGAPDLVLSAISIDPPAGVVSGQTITARWTISNSGNLPTIGSFDEHIRVQNIDTGQTLLDQVVRYDMAVSGPVTAGGSQQRALTFRLPDGPGGAGNLRLTIATDSGEAAFEYNAGGTSEFNNSSSLDFTTSLAPYPDVVVQGVRVIPAEGVQSGSWVTVQWSLLNTGQAPAAGTWNDNVVIRHAVTGEILATGSAPYNLGLIAPGASINRSLLLRLPDGERSVGPLQVSVTADVGSTLFEHHTGHDAEANNASSFSFTSTLAPYPDLVVTRISAPQQAISGQTIIVSWTVNNPGDGPATGTWLDRLYLSPDAAVGDDLLMGSFSFTGTVPVGGSVTRSQFITLPEDMAGPRYVIVITDANDLVPDYPADNNTTVGQEPIAVARRTYSNLVVEQVTPPSTAFSGHEVVLQWIVRNIGETGTAGAWQDSAYLSADATYDPADLFLGSVGNAAFLDVGEAYLNSMVARLPNGIDGDYYIVTRADFGNSIKEGFNEGDNTATSAAFRVQLAPPPDLQVTAIALPSMAFSGQPIHTGWTVKNLGDGATRTGSWSDAVFLSADAELSDDDVRLATVGHSGALNAGGSYRVTDRTVQLPVGVSGLMYMLVRTDVSSQVFESAFANNNVLAVPMIIGLTPPPDLEVEAVLLAAVGYAGRDYTISYTVTNFGATATPPTSWSNAFYISRTAELDLATAVLLGTRSRSGALYPDQPETRSATFRLPMHLSGAYYVFVVSDSSAQVLEADETNNASRSGAIRVLVDRPDLVVQSLAAQSTALAGRSMLADLTVANIGVGATYPDGFSHQLYLSTDSVFGNGELLPLTVVGSAALAAGESRQHGGQLLNIPLEVPEGQYWLFAVADHGRAQVESDETNNVSSPAMVYIARQLPDLRVVGAVAPATAESDSLIAISWTVENAGSGTFTASFGNEFYLSRDGTMNGEVHRLTPAVSVSQPPLQPGASRQQTAMFRLPLDVAGDYYIIVRTDPANGVFEADETNNQWVSAAPIRITLAPTPDLVVAAVNAPAEAYSGRPMTVSWTITNEGERGTENSIWYDSVYLSPDSTLDPATDFYLGFVARPSALEIDQSHISTGTFTLPQNLGGIFYILVRSDSTFRIHERNAEDNNVGASIVPTLVTITPPADLAVDTIIIPVNAMPGRPASITYTVTNAGDQAAQGSWYDSVYISADGQWDLGDPLFARYFRSGSLMPGSSYTAILSAALPGVVPGEYHVIVRSDILNHIPESTSANNILASLDRMETDAELLPLGGSRDGTLGQNQSAYYRVEVPEGQTLRLVFDSDSSFGANELYVRHDAMPTRTVFDHGFSEAFSSDQTLTVPATRGGTYYVLAYGNGLPSLYTPAFTLLAELVPFSVREVTPGLVGNTGPATLIVRGAFYDRATAFELVAADGSVIPASAVRVGDAATAFVTFDLAGRPAGSYALRATQLSGATAQLDMALQAVAGAGAVYEAALDAPAAARPGNQFTMQVGYGNSGDADAIAPLLVVVSDSGLPIASSYPGLSRDQTIVYLMGVSLEGPAGILRPGGVHSVPIFASAGAGGSARYQLYVIEPDDAQPLDFDIVLSMLPSSMLSAADWPQIWPALQQSIGPTWGDFVRTLAKNASLLPPEMGSARSPANLLALEIQRVRAALGTSLSGRAFAQNLAVNLAGRRVTAHNVDTGQVFITTSLMDGSFLFDRVAPGTYEFIFEGAVQAGSERALVVDGQQTADVRLTLQPAAQLTGTVRDSGGGALAGARISAIDQNGAVNLALSDEAGRYTLAGLPAGTYTLQVEAAGQARARIADLAVFTDRIVRHFTLQPQAGITGTASADPSGPVGPFSAVAIRRDAGSTSDMYTGTFEGQSFVIAGLSAGTYDITISRAGYASEVRTVIVADGQTQAMPAVHLLPAARISGTVISAVAGASVGQRGVAVYANGVQVAAAMTDSAGAFAIEGLAAGTYALRIVGLPDLFSTGATLTLAHGDIATGVQLQIVAGATLSGRVTVPAGSPLTGSLPVLVISADGAVHTATTDATGHYRIEGLGAGDYVVTVPGTGVRLGVTINSITGEAYTADLPVTTAAATLGGRTLNAAGAPIANATVALMENGEVIAQVQSDAQGRYSFILYREGAFALQASANGASFAAQPPVALSIGESVMRDIIAGSGSVNLTLTGPAGSIADARVYLYHVVDDERLLVGRMNAPAGGALSFSGLAAGDYAVEVFGAANHAAEAAFTLAAGATAAVSAQLTQWHALAGIISANGEPVVGAMVMLTATTGSGRQYFALTEGDGSYAISHVAADGYELVIVASGFQAAIVSKVSVNGDLAIDQALSASGTTLTGRVVDASGQPISAFTTVMVADESGRMLGNVATAPDGTFAITTAQGAGLTLYISAFGYAPRAVALAEVLGGTANDLGNVALDAVAIGMTQAQAAEAAWAAFAAEAGEPDAPSWLQALVDAFMAGFQRSPEHAGYEHMLPVPPLDSDCFDTWNPLFRRAMSGIELQNSALETTLAYETMAKESAIAALGFMVLEPAAALGAIAAAGLAIKGLLAMAGVGAAMSGGWVTTYAFVQIGEALLVLGGEIYDVFQSSTSASNAYERLLEVADKVQSLQNNLTEMIIELGNKNPGAGLKKFLSKLSVVGAIIGLIGNAKTLLDFALLTNTRGALDDLKSNLQTYESSKLTYERAVVEARARIDRYNAAVSDCEDRTRRTRRDPGRTPRDEREVQFPRSSDPNDILGPAGAGEQNWTATSQPFRYTIRFENEPSATAPAQEVLVTQQLDADLDWRSFRIGDFGWGEYLIPLPATQGFHLQRIDLTANHGFMIDFSALVDLSTGLVTFRFITIDPATGEKPENPLIGFLPINTDEGIGEGFVSYTVRPLRSAASGTVIDAAASIIFDINPPIDTPAIFNTLDTAAPVSSVLPLPASSNAVFTVAWTGADDAGGSGIAGYDIFLSIDDGPFALWLENTPLVEAPFSGEAGRRYAFHSVARDHAGNAELPPADALAWTLVGSANTTPILDLGGTGATAVGGVFGRTGSFADPDLGDAWSATVDYGDGSGSQELALNPGQTFNLAHAYGTPGVYTITVSIDDGLAEGNEEFQVVAPGISGRHVFYNNSFFDGNDPAASAADDQAIATDKLALLPGQTASFVNYTSYSLGINGIMIDVAGLLAAPTLDDFIFNVGNGNDPEAWVSAAVPLSISLRAGAGVGGSDRITIIWADNAIQKQWLQVVLLGSPGLGLAQSDVFYFGNAIGDSGNSTANTIVNATDQIAARNNAADSVPIISPHDYNRDGRVDVNDERVAKANGTVFLTALNLIVAPSVAPALAVEPAMNIEAPAPEAAPEADPQPLDDEQILVVLPSDADDSAAGWVLPADDDESLLLPAEEITGDFGSLPEAAGTASVFSETPIALAEPVTAAAKLAAEHDVQPILAVAPAKPLPKKAAKLPAKRKAITLLAKRKAAKLAAKRKALKLNAPAAAKPTVSTARPGTKGIFARKAIAPKRAVGTNAR